MPTTPFIETDTCLMPQHVPGARAGTGYRRIEMVPAHGTQGLIFTVDLHARLRLWISSEAGATRWVCVDALFAGDIGTVVDFSVEQNVTAGRLDGTLDLMVIAQIGDSQAGAAIQRRWYVFNAVPASADAQAWRELFANARAQDTRGLLPESARWGQAPRPYRSRLLHGHDAQGRPQLLWQRFDGQGRALHDALEPPWPGAGAPTQIELACIVDVEDQGVRREGYARHLAYEEASQGKAGYMALVWPEQDGRARSEAALTALNGSLRGWDSGEGLWPLTLTDSGSATRIYFDSTRSEQGVITASLQAPSVNALRSQLPGAAVPGRVRALRWQGDDDRILRLDLVRQSIQASPDLRLTESRDFAGIDNARSTLLSDSVAAFSVCLCNQPHGALQVLHVALVHEQGGIELLSQDSVSGLWQRATLADDDVMGAIHEVSTHTSTLRVLDQTRAPVPDARILVRADVPCHAWIGGRSVHLSPLGPTEVQADSLGQCRIAQVSNGLSASQLRLEVIDPQGQASNAVELAINPMQPLSERMRAIHSGTQLQQAPGFDGKPPFAAVPLARCDSTSALLKRLIAAYDHTIAHPTHPDAAQPPRRILRRMRVRFAAEGLQLDDEPVPEGAMAAPHSELDRIGDMLGYLWSQGVDPGTYLIEELAGGGYQLAMQIGDRLWKGLIALPQHAMALIDHAVQLGLGVSLRDITNWLGQLFNWDEILATKDTMRQLMALMRKQSRDWVANTAPAAIAEQMDWARQALTRLPDLDPKTRDMLERGMTSGPGPQPYASTQSGPASGWALASIQDHAASASIGAGGQWGFASEIAALFSGLAQEIEDVVEAFMKIVSQLDMQRDSLLTLLEDTIALASASLVDLVGQLCIKLCALVARCIDAMWDVLDQRLDIPVLTALYEKIAPGSRSSALDLMLLASAIAGDVGSRAIASRPIFSPEMTQAIANARSLTELLQTADGPEAELQWATVLQMIVTAVVAPCKLVHFGFWMVERNTPAGAPFEANVVRVKCASDTLAWAISLAWATARCATSQPPSEALKGSVTYLIIEGLIERAIDGIEMYYAQQGQPIPDVERATLRGFTSVIGGIFLGSVVCFAGISAVLTPREEPSDATNWDFLIAMPLLQGASAVALLASAALETNNAPPSVRVFRTVINGVRCATPLLSWIGLISGTVNGWRVPGTIAN